ncbi:manganese catalase family protein [Domibacillus sp. DTU_2020_1001157_1_SI_ALB_TIR_016]|uniref:manganese catalase family protein n=1 Tax=Domibacillus sp. DTU_2020_1001157_1_SI_ALB_TIR_016 TaxID=3077789 RepID=UPI0028E493FA|nr:manganese catalase family protein [Domibacillus sp. DTU_2020_1001157_1_SI_ALB_TIR_016]WNS81058.1 manganese catalase family protein [Domibacillus sp. DTU_2020_1001157_1_SI_ALB_TIR_016]
MFKRMNRLAVELPIPEYGCANSAAAVQELLGGKFGEMSTLNNYLFQSFNFRQKKKLKPFYDLVASITAEEVGHVELVSTTVNLLLKGTTFNADPDCTPLQNGLNKRNTQHFIASAQASLPVDSMGLPWNGTYVFSSGNLTLDLLHNFFLEVGARTHKMRVYEMTDHPTAREMIGYLLVRGGTHILAYAKAIEMITGADVTKMIPVPHVPNAKFDTTRKFEEQGLNNVLYTWNDAGEYEGIRQIWKGTNPESNEPLKVITGSPKGAPIPDLDDLPQEFAPGLNPDHYEWIAKKLMDKM